MKKFALSKKKKKKKKKIDQVLFFKAFKSEFNFQLYDLSPELRRLNKQLRIYEINHVRKLQTLNPLKPHLKTRT